MDPKLKQRSQRSVFSQCWELESPKNLTNFCLKATPLRGEKATNYTHWVAISPSNISKFILTTRCCKGQSPVVRYLSIVILVRFLILFV
jgi:hypothetical protein